MLREKFVNVKLTLDKRSLHKSEVVMSLDWNVLNWIQENLQCDFLDVFMSKFTLLGEMGIIWIAIAIGLLISKKHKKAGLLVLIGLLLGVIIGNGILKNLVMRSRPCWINTDFNLLIANPKDYSFPSGHALSSTIAATVITLYRKKWGIIVIPITALMAFSRLYLYVHFPTDILGGIVMGIIIGYVTYFCGNKIIDSVGKKKNAL